MTRPYRGGTASDLRRGPDLPPADELRAAEAALGVLQHIVHPISRDDLSHRREVTWRGNETPVPKAADSGNPRPRRQASARTLVRSEHSDQNEGALPYLRMTLRPWIR
ncbi:hypothetical protein [Mycobacterium sp.]|uniref:hypothetical protein n=1 Tax=Mycobacterium sp. TaxID=1785 RepID=UPI0031D554BE